MSDSCTSQTIGIIGASASAIATHSNDTSVHSVDTDSNSFKSVKCSLPWEMADAEEVADGYTLVQKGKKKSKQGANPGTSVNQAECQQSNSAPPQESYRLFFPKGVSPRDRTIWLADVAHKHRNLSVQPRLTASKIHHCSDARLGHRQVSHQDRPSVQRHHHEADKDYRGQQTNKGNHTQLSLIHDPGVHRGPPICIMGGERYTSRQPSTQESGVCILAERTTDNAAVSGNETLQGGEVCRETSFLWQLPEMGTQSVAMRREDKVRVLCGESRLQVVQGENRQWGEYHTKVPKLLSGTQCLESQVSPTTKLTPPCRQGSGDPSRGTCVSFQRVSTSVPGDTPATLTPDPPPADA